MGHRATAPGSRWLCASPAGLSAWPYPWRSAVALEKVMSWEGMPLGRSRKERNHSSLLLPNNSTYTHESAPQMTAQMAMALSCFAPPGVAARLRAAVRECFQRQMHLSGITPAPGDETACGWTRGRERHWFSCQPHRLFWSLSESGFEDSPEGRMSWESPSPADSGSGGGRR